MCKLEIEKRKDMLTKYKKMKNIKTSKYFNRGISVREKKASHILLLLTIACLFACKTSNEKMQVADITPCLVIPNENQIRYHKQEIIGFVHFTINTFTSKEWGFGDESPSLFNPSELNTDQWAEVAKAAGMKTLMLTAKHHDGFCLWPSKYTEHSVKKSPYKNGKGDVVKEFVESCRKQNIAVGLYLSPWDRNHAAYARPEYIKYYRNQLTEILTNYGEVVEVWFDGANGGDGYYGGANEIRHISPDYYDWDSTFALVHKLQPKAVFFNDFGEARWIGNERGIAGETNWAKINRNNAAIGSADREYINSGDPHGKDWSVGECDVSIRPNWFYHKKEDTLVKTPQYLVDLYYKSVGRNAVLLLNIPPDKRGLFHENDVANLKEFKSIIDETFSNNLAKNKKATASSTRLNHAKFNAINTIDDNTDTYWATDDSITTAAIIIDLGEEKEFDRIMLQEPIRFGQRVEKFAVAIQINNEWKKIAQATTIGYKRILRFETVKASKIKIQINQSQYNPAIANIGVYKASNRE